MRKPFLLFSAMLLAAAGAAAAPLFDVSRPGDVKISPFCPSSEFKVRGDRIDVTLKAGKDRWQGVVITPLKEKYFDLSAGSVVAVDVRNRNRYPMHLNLEIVNLLRPDKPNEFTHISPGAVALMPGEKATLRVRYGRAAVVADWAPQGMKYLFDGFGRATNCQYNIVPEKVGQLRIWSTAGDRDMKFELSNFRLEDPPKPLPEAFKSKEAFYPFIDEFGQYKHADWPGKLKNVSELKERREAEDRDLAAHPGTAGRTKFGGWADGPTFDSKGGWSTIKYRGKWFFVDPEGKLFWSLGMNSIELDACDPTGITYRESYFEKLPEKTKENEVCYSTRRFPRFGFYKGKEGDILQFYFYRYNLIRKYGAAEHWNAFLDRSQQRLRSWGFNTNGNWLEQQVLERENHLPYMSAVHFDKFYQVIEGCKLIGWQKFPDVFNPEFEAGLAKALRGRFRKTTTDPYCIGYFVDNELSWGKSDTFLAEGALRSPATQPAKIALADHLKKKYGDIEALNRAWGTSYRDFDDFLAKNDMPSDPKRAQKDLEEFNDVIVNRYFATCKAVINREAPGKLYFGCRFNDWNVKVIRTAAKYLDACSFNLYRPQIGCWSLPEGVDMPVVVGEWHYGTANSGPSHPGLQAAANQTERARGFDRYIRSALWNPQIAGVHYFKYCDQATTGRPPDDENIQCGFVDVTDTPYREMVDAARKVSSEMYQYRLSEGPGK